MVMLESIPKISVLIITYRQEELIIRAINSLLSQKDYIYEICISDDCSPDRTWEVLQEFDKQYPGLFKLHRNDYNLGIFENIEYTLTMPNGDIIYQLAGDDECGEGWFKTVIEYIQNNHLNYKNELFCIYGDFKSIYPNGDSIVFRNNYVSRQIDPISLAIRLKLYNRSVCYSIKILQKFVKCSKGRSHIAEMAQDRQIQVLADKNYYIPYIGNIYYTRIGISVHMDVDDIADRESSRAYAKSILEQLNYNFSKKDKYVLRHDDEHAKLYRKNTFPQHIKIWWLYWRGFDSRIDLNLHYIKRITFAICRRLPHSNPIHWTL